MHNSSIKIFVCGDVMTGRGIDQILKHPCHPQIYESYVRDARDYVKLAERLNGKIPHPADASYPWGDALLEWNKRSDYIKAINLETSVTCSENYWPNKGINYRMHPKNIDVLNAAGIDLCALANNHILDWGLKGLEESTRVLNKAQIKYAGVGKDLDEARRPAIIELPMGKRILFFSLGLPTSGIPFDWEAGINHPGVYMYHHLDQFAVEDIRKNIQAYKQDGDLIIVSIHWGGNWGYDISQTQISFTHSLIDDCGVDMIHGHSSHHPLGLEIYHQKPVLYGCGDFLNDYEGISGMEIFRGDLSLMYFLEFHIQKNELSHMELVPLQMRNFKLHYAGHLDSVWLWERLIEASIEFKTTFRLTKDRTILVGVKPGEL